MWRFPYQSSVVKWLNRDMVKYFSPIIFSRYCKISKILIKLYQMLDFLEIIFRKFSTHVTCIFGNFLNFKWYAPIYFFALIILVLILQRWISLDSTCCLDEFKSFSADTPTSFVTCETITGESTATCLNNHIARVYRRIFKTA